ncbi:glycosyltransferase [Methylomonas sp. 2BW1-5-20]|uniref:glycosyltransferase n=1 Tax=Methylomonas sp. 2BW1-5-20 TaxID=3376686 RepID=UPI00404FFE2E
MSAQFDSIPNQLALKLSGKNIIIVLPTLEIGGAERQALNLAQYLQYDLCANVQIWGLRAPGALADLCDQYGITWRLEPFELTRHPFAFIANLIRYAYRLNRAKTDVILSYTTFPNGICALVWRMARAKLCIWNQRDSGIERFGRLECLVVRSTVHFLSNSYQGKKFLNETLGVANQKIRVIPNGVHLASPRFLRGEWRTQLEVPEECLIACMVANLSHYKDHATLVRAWQLVIHKWTDGKPLPILLLAGRFDDTYSSVRDLIDNLKLTESVRMLGPVHDIAGLLAASDLALFSSRSEGMPNAILEYLAAGLPIVSTDLPAIREIASNRMCEFLSPPNDVNTMANNILHMLLSPQLRGEIGSINLRNSKLYSSELMCQKTAELIAELI